MKLSPSQIKAFIGSKSKRAGRYILWIVDAHNNDSLALWTLFEQFLITGDDNYKILEEYTIDNMEKLITDYDNLKHNAIWLNMPMWATQVKVEWVINDIEFVWYIDNLVDWVIYDIKTAQYLSKVDNTTKNMRSWMSYYEEYELQMRIYMRLWHCTTARIAEVAKYRYKDWNSHNQIIEFMRSDEWDKKMEQTYFPIMDEMKELYSKYKLK